jgi:hypothetical protein
VRSLVPDVLVVGLELCYVVQMVHVRDKHVSVALLVKSAVRDSCIVCWASLDPVLLHHLSAEITDLGSSNPKQRESYIL